ncbi:inorganic phosphate transporter [Blattabacterium cuenoti]|uniref:inorganic phosphate transporter n=1 Tax=Blattabacterium cuenoti TaxID=1653831 RepID=UPI00163BE62A|nr:inorganic phosphate transporter [Blattabacterium cuenoti]
MKLFYPSIIVILFVLSIFDLIVGVINDAVNFLNSAIGSKVASRRTIMIFSSLGILLGSILSSGMMEVARKGIFNPSYFYFSDLTFIFLSVMISDIILLDVFNTLGLPTSTTVSMVFCLLGGAFIISIIKMSSPLNHEPLHHLSQYIKAEKILTIVIGIFLSIIISFTSGALIHYFIRLLLSFEYKNRLKYVGVIWAAISLSSMTYFIIFRGLHSALQGFREDHLTGLSLCIQYFIKWIHHNFFIFLFLLFSTWTIISKIFVSLGYNILKFVVLYGTFSLSMAFSGNDLVNFIGIPIASIQSYKIWKEAGSPTAEKFNMKGLSDNVQVPSLVLISSGIIMILTLFFSKKTKNITSTELNLSRQNEGNEKFLSNSFSRGIVRFFLYFGNKFFKLFPKRFLVKIEKNFKQKIQQEDNVAFDLVRASANLTISSILISIATVQKLPLSTTFVTFMVSMGTSLSDRAWDRESAVYRVSGVLKVIRGWFLTGFIAFAMSGITASFLYFLKDWALIFFIFLIIFIFYKNYQKCKYQKLKEKKIIIEIGVMNLGKNFINKTSDILENFIQSIENIYTKSIKGITQDNLKNLQYNRTHFLKIKENFTYIQNTLIQVIRNNKKNESISAGILYLQKYNKTKDIIESADIITYRTLLHVINSHKPLKYRQKNNLMLLDHFMMQYFKLIKQITFYRNFKQIKLNHTIKIKILKTIEDQINQQVMGIIHQKYGTKNTLLMLDLLLQSKKITEKIEEILLLYHKV